MTAPLRLSSVDVGRTPQPDHSMETLEMKFQIDKRHGGITADGWIAARVPQALWTAFPEATSENDLAERAATYFRNKRTGEAIDPRTIRYWLRGEAVPHGSHMFTLIWMVGADFFRIPRQGAR